MYGVSNSAIRIYKENKFCYFRFHTKGEKNAPQKTDDKISVRRAKLHDWNLQREQGLLYWFAYKGEKHA